MRSLALNIPFFTFSGSVSYTHLDVYKRQDIPKPNQVEEGLEPVIVDTTVF